jgi:hypothetical protein
MSGSMMNFRNRLKRSNSFALAVGMTGALFVVSCGDDDGASETTNEGPTDTEDASTSNDETNEETTDEPAETTEGSGNNLDTTSSEDPSTDSDAGIVSDGGATSDDEGDAGEQTTSAGDSGVDAGPPVEPETSFIVGGWISGADDVWYGVLGVVDDLSSNNTFDVGNVVSFDGDFTFTEYEGAVFVGHQENPIIQKWIVNADGQLELEDSVSFQAFGVLETHGASHNVIQVIDDETAWFFDHDNGRVITFNPSDMSTTGETIDYYAIYDGLDLVAGDWPDIGDVGRVGDYIAVPMFWYAVTDDTIPLDTRIALINTKNNDVTIVTDDRCAGSNVMANDSDGNLYFGPHAAAALWSAEGSAGDAVPCIIRILNGQDEVDQDYLVNLKDLNGGKAVAGPFQGRGDTAYVLQFDGELGDGPDARSLDEWNLYSIELGADDPGYTQVAGWPQGSSQSVAFSLQVGTEIKHYLGSVAADGENSAYYEILPDGRLEEGLNFTIYPAQAVNY